MIDANDALASNALADEIAVTDGFTNDKDERKESPAA